MPLKFSCIVFLLLSVTSAIAITNTGFTYNGFQHGHLSLDGTAEIARNSILKLTNGTKEQKGHAFYPKPFRFKKTQNNSALSFSTTFVFAIVPRYHESSGHGITFFLAPSKDLSQALPSGYLGLFNQTSNGKSSNHILAVELDTILSSHTNDINDNHIGIDINDLKSVISAPVSYYIDDSPGDHYRNLSLTSGKRMQVWIEYDGLEKLLNVTVAPFRLPRPKIPLLSLNHDISPALLESMYVGFSASTGSVHVASHCILGWSFQLNGQARELDLSHLPKLPRNKQSKVFTIELPVILSLIVLFFIFGTVYLIRRKRKLAGEVEDWELSYGGQRFSYQELYMATKGFKETELLGSGGFGRVYRGVLGTSKRKVAVKGITHDTKQGIKQFIAEVVSLGNIKHRNLVQLLGYCRQKDELFLVYDHMPNGSLDKLLFSPLGSTLTWKQRFRIIKGMASGLLYLHEEWKQVVVHRDIKASNVLIDGDFNGRLGDFGLARLHDHGTIPRATRIAGTLGYLAPEMARTGKATTRTDVFAFGVFLLEVACGRRPLEPQAHEEAFILVDWVIKCWNKGNIFETTDPKLGSNYVKQEMEIVLKLGLLCSHSIARCRPSMRRAVQILDKDITLPELSSGGFSSESQASKHGHEEFDAFAFSGIEESLFSSGR